MAGPPEKKAPLPPAPPLARRGPGRPPNPPAPDAKTPGSASPAPEKKPARALTETTIRAAYVGFWFLARFALSFFGWESDVKSLPEPELKEDVPELVAWAKEYPSWALRVLAWIGGPLIVLQRMSQHFHRRSREKKPEPSHPAPGAAA